MAQVSGVTQGLFKTVYLAAGFVADVHIFDPLNSTWMDISGFVRGVAPLPSFGYGITSVSGNIYLHGGNDKGGHPSCISFFLSESHSIYCFHLQVIVLIAPQLKPLLSTRTWHMLSQALQSIQCMHSHAWHSDFLTRYLQL